MIWSNTGPSLWTIWPMTPSPACSQTHRAWLCEKVGSTVCTHGRPTHTQMHACPQPRAPPACLGDLNRLVELEPTWAKSFALLKYLDQTGATFTDFGSLLHTLSALSKQGAEVRLRALARLNDRRCGLFADLHAQARARSSQTKI